jgi:hypothetical protein
MDNDLFAIRDIQNIEETEDDEDGWLYPNNNP